MRYAGIQYDDIVNGDGIRVTLFVQGCDHHCHNCHNPETWDLKGGEEFTEKVQESIFNYIKYTPFVKGLTLSGGDPLQEDNLPYIKQLLLDFRKTFKDTKDVWLYTGSDFEDLFYYYRISLVPGITLGLNTSYIVDILHLIDVLVDGEYIDELRDINLKFRGSSNQKLIDVKQTIKTKSIVYYKEV